MHTKKSQKNIDIKQSRNNSSSRKIRGDSSGAVVSGLLNSNNLKQLIKNCNPNNTTGENLTMWEVEIRRKNNYYK